MSFTYMCNINLDSLLTDNQTMSWNWDTGKFSWRFLCQMQNSSNSKIQGKSLWYVKSLQQAMNEHMTNIAYLAAASWELVVISIANWTDFCKASLVLWSTGSTDWISMLVMTRLFWGKWKESFTLRFSSTPNTEALMIFAEFWNKNHNDRQYLHWFLQKAAIPTEVRNISSTVFCFCFFFL